MILLTHPTGNTFSRAVLDALLKADRLGVFATSIAVEPTAAWLQWAPGSLRKELLRRRFDVPRDRLITRPWLELLRLAGPKLGARFLAHHETGLASFDAVYQDLDRHLARRLPELARTARLTGVYGYEGGALDLFRAAKRTGLKCFYDLPIAYWETSKRLLAEEALRWPEWEPTLMATRDSEAKCRRKVEEMELADLVVCPSQFVLDSIPEPLRQGRACIVAEFGSPTFQAPPAAAAPGQKLRILFAGSMTQRKGLADLFAAMKLLGRKDVELVVMGGMSAPLEFYRSQYADFVYEPTRPHAEVLKLMATCDALVLPSIVEGRALVQQEAMACGLPLLVTANAGAQDLVIEGRTGFLVPIRSPEAIADRIAWLADHRSALPDMKQAARAMAATVTWERYSRKVLEAMDESLAAAPKAQAFLARAGG